MIPRKHRGRIFSDRLKRAFDAGVRLGESKYLYHSARALWQDRRAKLPAHIRVADVQMFGAEVLVPHEVAPSYAADPHGIEHAERDVRRLLGDRIAKTIEVVHTPKPGIGTLVTGRIGIATYEAAQDKNASMYQFASIHPHTGSIKWELY